MLTGIKKRPIASSLYHLVWETIDWLYPPVCGGCGKGGQRWCPHCQQESRNLDKNICPTCGNWLSKTDPSCPDCNYSKPPFQMLRSWGLHKGALRNGVHRLKYQNDIGLGEVFGLNLAELYKELNWQTDLVTTVPLSKKRMKERGYNQSDYIARPFALALRLPFKPRVLSRNKETKSQVGLSLEARHENVSSAFRVSGDEIDNKSVTLIDDVATTGATLTACSQEMLRAGAKEVYCLTVSRAVLSDKKLGKNKQEGV